MPQSCPAVGVSLNRIWSIVWHQTVYSTPPPQFKGYGWSPEDSPFMWLAAAAWCRAPEVEPVSNYFTAASCAIVFFVLWFFVFFLNRAATAAHTTAAKMYRHHSNELKPAFSPGSRNLVWMHLWWLNNIPPSAGKTMSLHHFKFLVQDFF